MSFFFQAEDGIRDFHVTGVQTCALPISRELHPVLLDTGAVTDGLEQRRCREVPDVVREPDELVPRALQRSEERRVGKECITRQLPIIEKKKLAQDTENVFSDLAALNEMF